MPERIERAFGHAGRQHHLRGRRGSRGATRAAGQYFPGGLTFKELARRT